MIKILNFLLFLFLTSLIAGQLIRFELRSSIVLYPSDFILLGLVILSLIYFFAVKKSFFLPRGSIFVIIFVLMALVSLFNSIRFFSTTQVFVGSLFLVRFFAFFLFYLIFYNLTDRKKLWFWSNILIVEGLILAIIGFFQLIFFYELTFLQDFGFDPHVGRLVSTFLDPNFFGGFQILILNLGLSNFLIKKEKWLLPVCLILFASIILTFSRSSYLALLVSILLFGFLASRRLAIAAFGLFILIIPVIPRILERILGAVSFDVTAIARIESWQQALKIFSASPLLGVGFNNLRFAKVSLGLFRLGEGLGGHSGAGVDSSFLQVLATTGILGIISFLAFYIFFTQKFFKNRKLPVNLATFITMISLFIHSQFVNSLFFPSIAAVFWIKIAMSNVEESDKN